MCPMLLLGLVFLLPALAPAATYHVALTGNDRASCQASTPCRTINGGLARMRGGDTLVVQPGVYEEILADAAGVGGYTVRIPSGRASGLTTIKAATSGTVTLRVRQPPPGWSQLVMLEQSQYVSLEGLRLDGEFRMSFGIGIGGRHLRLQDLEILNTRNQGIQGWCETCEFLNLDVHHIALKGGQTTCDAGTCGNPPGQPCPGYCHALYVKGTGIVIDGGRYHDNDGYGIHLYPSVSSSVIRNVCAYRNGTVGIGLFHGSDNEIANATAVNNGRYGVWIKTSQTRLRESQLAGNRGGNLQDDSGGSLVVEATRMETTAQDSGETCGGTPRPRPRVPAPTNPRARMRQP
jgi:Right handed beta helix region